MKNVCQKLSELIYYDVGASIGSPIIRNELTQHLSPLYVTYAHFMIPYGEEKFVSWTPNYSLLESVSKV